MTIYHYAPRTKGCSEHNGYLTKILHAVDTSKCLTLKDYAVKEYPSTFTLELFTAALEARKLARCSENTVIIHYCGLFAVLAALSSPFRIIFWFKGSDFYPVRGRNAFKNLCALLFRIPIIYLSRRLLVVNQDMKRQIEMLLPSKTCVLQTPVETINYDRFQSAREDIQEPLPFTFRPFIYVANNPRNKGLNLFNDAIKMLEPCFNKIEPIIINGSYLSHAQYLRQIKSSSCVCVLSFSEGSNNTIREAIIQHKPVVATCCGDAIDMYWMSDLVFYVNWDHRIIASTMLKIAITQHMSALERQNLTISTTSNILSNFSIDHFCETLNSFIIKAKSS